MTFDRLFDVSNDLIAAAEHYAFKRTELFKRLMPPKQNVIILKGARGIGKSTLMQQFLCDQQLQGSKVLYVSADSTLLTTSLAEFAQDYQKRGGVFLAIDEIHKYENWQSEIKTILDSFTGLKLLVSGSSSLHLDYASTDLSRRHVMISAKGLSFREYLEKTQQVMIDPLPLDLILSRPGDIVRHIVNSLSQKQLDLLGIFKQYLRDGYFLSRDNYDTEMLYYESLLNTINSVIESDLPYTYNDIDQISKQNIKKLLRHISAKCPLTPNIAELSRNLKISNDNTLKKYLFYLSGGEILTNLYPSDKTHKDFQRPQKIFLNNTNYIYAQNANPNMGTVRETFIANCLQHQGVLTAPTFGDFCLDDDLFFEVGGRSKNRRQLKSVKKGYVIADDVLSVEHDKLPLWLFGFLW